MSLTLSFLGGAGTVTGSKYLLKRSKQSILVDCGLFQGYKALRLRNWTAATELNRNLRAVVLTHAHLDHSGYLPLLVKNGYRGPIYCTKATADLCAILLPDSGHLQEQDADYANRRHFSRHNPALPLYTVNDARRVLDFLTPISFDQPKVIADGASLRFIRAGHILGAASACIEWDGKKIVFSGDIGRYDDPLMFDPQTPEDADYLLMESTYGDRLHEHCDVEDVLADIINRTVRRGGTIIVPAFAVGRAQSLLFHIARIKTRGQISAQIPVFLNSPMAIDATEIFRRNAADHRLGAAHGAAMYSTVKYVRTPEESIALNANPAPKVIISASGMATGGRVLHHLESYAPDPRHTILFTGFQAAGTRGAAMVGGAKDIKIHGKYIPVRAEIQNLSMLSAHADKQELLRWAGKFKNPPRTTFIIHGEPQSADALRHALEEKLLWNCVVPDQGQEVALP